MRKKINILLGALIALLSGCKTTQEVATPSDRIMVLYGPPAYFESKGESGKSNVEAKGDETMRREGEKESNNLQNSK